MRKGPIYFAAITVAVVGGFVGGRAFRHRDTGESGAAATAPAGGPSDGVERKRIPLVGLPRGAPVAPVTIVEFSDFQCPYCGRVTPTVDELFKAYPGRLRLYFRHFPLPFHADAPLASEAALAADAQGKFWQMHDKLFADQQALKGPDLEVYRVPVGKAPVRGAKQPKVTLVEYSDFQCPYCGRVVATLDRVLKEHPSDVALAFKEFPLPSLHPHAVAAAMAAVAAQEQGKF